MACNYTKWPEVTAPAGSCGGSGGVQCSEADDPGGEEDEQHAAGRRGEGKSDGKPPRLWLRAAALAISAGALIRLLVEFGHERIDTTFDLVTDRPHLLERQILWVG
jgi:hypothetical protein